MKKQRKTKAAEPELLATEVLAPEVAPVVEQPTPPDEPDKLTIVLQENQIGERRATELTSAFKEHFTEAREILEKAATLNVTSPDQKADMDMARHLRLRLKSVRVAADKRREALKQDSLREGRAIQGIYNVLDYMVRPMEEKLEKMEKLADELERQRKENLRMEREAALLAVGFNSISHLNLAEMPAEDYESLLKDATFMHESRQRRAAEEAAALEKARMEREEAESRIKTERIETAKRRRAKLEDAKVVLFVTDEFLATMSEESLDAEILKIQEREQARKDAEAEAERLRQEREQAEREAAEERRKRELLHGSRMAILATYGIKLSGHMDLGSMDDAQFEVFRIGELARMKREVQEKAERERLAAEAEKLRREAAERERQEAEQKAAEESARKAREAEERRAARAPDKAKLEAYLAALDSVPVPEMKTDAGQQLLDSTESLLDGVFKNIRMGIAKL